MSRFAPILLLAVPFFGGLSAQQQIPELPAGTRIRLTIMKMSEPSTRVAGSLVSSDATSLVLLTARTDAPARFPLTIIEEIELSRGPGFCTGSGRRAACVLVGTAGGLLVGATVGGLLTQSADGYGMVGGIMVGGVAGGIGGLLTGATVGGERWERLDIASRETDRASPPRSGR